MRELKDIFSNPLVVCVLADTENLGLGGICLLKGLHPLLIVTYKHLTISVSILLLCLSLEIVNIKI